MKSSARTVNRTILGYAVARWLACGVRVTRLVLLLIASAPLLNACNGSDGSGMSGSSNGGGSSATSGSGNSGSPSGTSGGGSQGGGSGSGSQSGPPQTLTITSPSPPGGMDYARYNPKGVLSCKLGTPCSCYPGGVLGRSICYEYGFQLAASGGTPPYSWVWAASTGSGLPPGLSLSAAGLINGKPSRAGAYAVLVILTDSSQPAAQATVTYTITIRPPPLSHFQTVSTLAAGVKVPFSFSFSDTGGQPPLTWSETGVLPAGFSVSSAGVLSGTPLVTGSFPVTVNVQDSAGQSSSQALTVVITPHGFGTTGGMTTPRSQHTATLLGDGTVLVAGGNNNGNAVADSELYRPADAGFSPTGALGTARYAHTATRLGTGQVLVTGGNDSNGLAVTSAELYDPGTRSFTALGNMVSARASHTDTLLGNGQVLLTGGATQSTYGVILFMQATAELFDPATRSFSATGSMSTPRAGHTATLLRTGKVLIAGGFVADGETTESAELYDPSTGMFAPTGAMHDSRFAHTATLLANGTVLITGGVSATTTQAVNVMLTSAEIYDPKSGSFTTTGSLGTGRSFHTAALLGDGSVLLAGGLDQNGVPLMGAELYVPGTAQFVLTGGLQIPREEHTATVLGNGTVLVTGGNNSAPPGQTIVPGGNASGYISTAEVYQ